jgi:beta-galactosidase
MPNERGEAITNLVKQLDANQEAFSSFHPEKAKVVIGMSYRSRLFFDEFLNKDQTLWPDSVAGWYRVFWGMGLQVGFTNLDDLDDEDLNIPVLVLPSMISISEKTTQWIERFVSNGGTLIADARMKTIDEMGIVPKEGIPGEVLTQVFGIRELDVASEASFVLYGETIPLNFLYQILETKEGTQVLATDEDGKPAVVKNYYGQGATLYFNSFIGAELSKKVPNSISRLLVELIQERVSGSMLAKKSEKVHISCIESGNKKLMLVVNNSDVEETVTLLDFSSSSDIRNIFTNERLKASGEVELRIPCRQSTIFEWSMNI